ncbi:MAG: hypothetical protein IPF92_22280 [Myxococcales bacterium]|nr:hypothetical protein [Myxococcales bacterium]MBL0194570.1 hypothetical protein [Myxococcales bacterium]HQY64197.1 hypothetical protein [Polyangiaceae bacterium]
MMEGQGDVNGPGMDQTRRESQRTLAERCAAGVLAGAVVALAACGDSAPSKGTYSLVFPSVAAAVAAESVQVFVFDAPAANRATLCSELVSLRRSGRPLNPLARGPVLRVCDAQSPQGGQGELTVGYGDRAFLAVALRQGEDFLMGCAVQNVGTGDAPAKVYLAPASPKVTVPATTCSSLSDACGGRCK